MPSFLSIQIPNLCHLKLTTRVGYLYMKINCDYLHFVLSNKIKSLLEFHSAQLKKFLTGKNNQQLRPKAYCEQQHNGRLLPPSTSSVTVTRIKGNFACLV